MKRLSRFPVTDETINLKTHHTSSFFNPVFSVVAQRSLPINFLPKEPAKHFLSSHLWTRGSMSHGGGREGEEG